MKTRLQLQHRRQSPIPAAFAESTLAAAVMAAEKKNKRPKQAKREAQKVARLLARGEL